MASEPTARANVPWVQTRPGSTGGENATFIKSYNSLLRSGTGIGIAARYQKIRDKCECDNQIKLN